MSFSPPRRSLRCILAIVLAGVGVRPCGGGQHTDAHRDGHKTQPHRRPYVRQTPEYLHAQNLVFPGHDGHIMPPTPQDWADYHAAAARQAQRPLFPDTPPGGRSRH